MNDPAPSAATPNYYPRKSTRKYPNVPCPRGHSTYAKHHNKIRYCPACRQHYTHAGAVYVVSENWSDDYGNEQWRALSPTNGRYNEEWTDIEDKPDAANMTQAARLRLLAAIEQIEREERAAALERWRKGER